MLLGCAGETGPTAVQALNAALAGGAVPDTWAPNGSSVRTVLAGPAIHCKAAAAGSTTLRICVRCQMSCCAMSLIDNVWQLKC